MSTLENHLPAPLEAFKSNVTLSTLGVLLVAVLWTLGRSAASGRREWIRVGLAPGLFGRNKKAAVQDFQQNGRALVRDGYNRNKGKNFVIYTAEKDQLIIAPKFLPEIRMLPETKISHAQVLMDYWVGEHIGADIAMGGAQHIDAVRGPLTRSLKTTVPMMHREYRRTSEFLFSQIPKDTKEMSVYQFCYATVSSMTSTVFIGEELTHAGGWGNIVMEYFPEAWRIRNALKPWPYALRPLVKPFVVKDNKLEDILAKAEQYLDEPIKKRRSPDNEDVDILKFLAEYNESPRKVALQVVGIITGALNTSTHALMEAIYHLCAHP
ncbi:cytochrome P450 monooxygenase SirB-like [Apiospora arundinis]